MDFVKLVLAAVVSFLIAFLLTPVIIKLYKKFGWLDDPGIRKHPKVVHRYPVPRGGGLVIFLAITLTSLVFLPLDKHLLIILLSVSVLAIVGLADDIFDLNPYTRIGFGLVACLLVVGGGIGIPFITNPLGGIIKLDNPQIPIYFLGKLRHIWVLADLFAAIWILSCINFVNWSKGIDGQLPGIVVVASLTIAFASFKFSADITQWPVAVLAFVVAGAYAGFLPFNFYPQKIMPGYGGGSIAGFMLAVLSILATTKVGTLVMVLGVPLVDALFVLTRRVVKGRSPVWGDATHLHHQLLALGWGKRRVTIFYWLVTLILGLLSLTLSSMAKLYTIFLLVTLLGIFFLCSKKFNLFLSRHGPGNG